MIVLNRKRDAGFTLIEVIVVFVVTAIVAAMLYTFFGDRILKSHEPKENFIKSTDLNQVMANIRADYKPYPVWKPGQPYALNDKVIPTAFSPMGQRYWYLCTTAGTSSTTEPGWTTGATAISDGATLKWTYQSTPALMTLVELETNIGAVDTTKKYKYDKSTHQYGYYVDEKKWIDFDLTTKIETASANKKILKVTIRNDAGEKITSLFF
jgi:prepilin-type N-terminal cleavage/methylation domain-containing protein